MIFCLLLVLMLALSQPAANAEEPNVGVLLVGVNYPRQAAPSSHLRVVIDGEYATHETAKIRASLFEGNIQNLGKEIWHGDPVNVTQGGDQLWNVNLTAPSAEGVWSLVAIAYFEDAGRWMFYNDTVQGPGYFEFSIKIAKNATLEVQLGVSGIEITIGETQQKTDADGSASAQLPVGQDYSVSVPQTIQLENSTRLVFNGWSDELNSTERTVVLDGDISLTANYRTQYLMQVKSPLPQYTLNNWYYANSNVTLKVAGTVPAAWPLNLLGVKHVFNGWKGALVSSSAEINVIVDGPKLLEADFVLDLTPLIVPLILVAGMIGGILLALLRRRAAAKPVSEEAAAEMPLTEQPTVKVAESAKPKPICPSCGNDVEEKWTHCIKCGAKLGLSEPAEGGEG